jgi:imidazolonepropionase-like amidohydrolase
MLAAGLVWLLPQSLRAQTDTAPDEGIVSRPPSTVLLQQATVWVPDGEPVQRDLLFRDGKIADIASRIAPPPGAEIINLDGKHVYPAFIDAYVELSLPASSDPDGHWNANIQPQRRAAEHLPNDDRLAAAYRRAGFGAILLAPNDALLKGSSSVVTTGRGSVSKNVLRNDVFQHAQLVQRGQRGSYPNSPMGAVALLRQTFSDAAWYQQAQQAFRADASLPAPDQNTALAALAPCVQGSQLCVFDGPNELYALRADRLAREFSLPAVIRGSGREYRQLSAIVETGRTWIVPVDFPKPPDVSSPDAAAAVSLQSLMHWYLAPENPSRLESASVPFVLTSHGLAAPNEILTQVRVAIARGLTEKAALAALTTRPAKLLGIEHLTGSIERGKLASVIVTDGPLFQKSTQVLETWIQGDRFRWKETPELDATGRWKLTLTTHDGLPAELDLQWDDLEKPKAKLGLPGALDQQPAQAAASTQPSSSTAQDSAPAAEQPSSSQSPTEPLELRKPDGDVKPASDSVPVAPPAAPESETSQTENPDHATDSGTTAETPAESETAKATAKESAKETANQKGEPTAQPEQPPEPAPKPPVAELKQFSIQDYRVLGTFEAKSLRVGESGLAYFSATLLKTPASGTKVTQLSGRITWPDGRISAFTAAQVGPDADAIQPSSNPTAEPIQSDKKPDKNSDKKPDKSESQAAATTAAADEKLCDVNYPLGAFGVTTAPEQPTWLLIRGATVWTCDQEGTLENADILIHRGIIEDVGHDLPAPEGAMVVDAQGKHISPGIIDCHSHMATDGGINESGQAITAEVRIGDFIDPTDMNIYRQLAGGVTVANVLHGSANPIGGQNQVIKLRWGALDEQMKLKDAPPGIKFALGENVKQSNWSNIDRANPRYPQSRMGVEQIMRDRFEAAKLYRAQWTDAAAQGKRLPPRRDYELDAIAEVLDGKRWIHCHSYRQDEILTFLRLLEDYGITVGSLQHILEGYKVAEAMARHGATGSTFSDWWAYKMEVWDAIPYNGALMHRAGIIVSFNSDDNELGRHLNHEAAKAIKYGGVPPEEALQFVTLNPAKQLRIDHLVGSLAKGKHADFVIWSGSPLSNLSRCEQTWIDGRRYFDRGHDRTARDEAARLHRQLVQRILQSGEKMSGNGVDPRDPSLWFDRHDAFCHHQHGEEELHAGHEHTSEAAEELAGASSLGENNHE